jgi:flagellar biosynthesis protein FlhB
VAEKTEAPTPRRLRETRRRGQIAVSPEATATAGFLAGALALAFVLPRVVGEFQGLLHGAAAAAAGVEAGDSARAWQDPLRLASLAALRILAPVVLALLVGGLGLAFAQAGLHAAPGRLAPDLARLNPGTALRRIFSAQGAVDLLRTVLKIAVVLTIGWWVVREAFPGIVALHAARANDVGIVLGGLLRSFTLRAGVALALLAALDYAIQRRRWMKGLMMTREEVRQEYKEQEGDPILRSQRRAMHQELANQQIVAEVRLASAVVVNPVHLAVAVRYDREGMAAPRVVAKGGGAVAKLIKKTAERADVPVVRDEPLAHALFAVEPGRYVPRDLYEAVAEVLLFASQVRRDAEREGVR